MWFSVVLAAVVCALVLFSALRGKKSGLPPGPRGLPIIGSLHCLMKDPFTKLRLFAERHGPVYTLKVGPVPVVVLSDIEAIQEAFSSKGPDGFNGRPSMMAEATGLGRKGLVLLNPGSYHKSQRKNVLSLLRELGVGTPRFDDALKPYVQYLLTHFGDTPKVISIKAISSSMMGDIIGGLTFGQSVYQDNSTTSTTVRKLISENFQTNPLLLLAGKFLPVFAKEALSNFVDMESNIAKMMRLMKRLIESHYSRAPEVDGSEQCFVGKYIREFARSHDGRTPDGDIQEEEQLGALIIDFFQAGCETTDIFLQWVLLLLAANPEVQRKAQEELKGIFGNEKPSLKLRSKLPYTTAILYEALRIRPPAPLGAPHSTTTEVTFRGYTLPADTTIMANLLTANFLEKDFPDPHKFRPERFLDENGQLKSVKSVLAFGTGSRMCIGEQLAKSITLICVMSILNKYDLRSKDGNDVDLSYFAGINIFPIEDQITVLPRQKDCEV